MSRDFRVAIRSLIQRPAFGLSVIFTLALGVGASTMMFSLVDAALLRRLPFERPERLVMLWGVAGPQRAVRGGSFSEVRDWRAMNRTLADVAIYDETSLNLTLGAEPVRVETEMVSASFFELLGARAALGRTFAADDDRVPDEKPVAIISDRLWRQRFGAGRDVLERLRLIVRNGLTLGVVGLVIGVAGAIAAGRSLETQMFQTTATDPATY